MSDYSNLIKYYMSIEEDFMKTCHYVEHLLENENAFSDEFAKIILLASSEVDDLFKTICHKIEGKRPERSKINVYAKCILPKHPPINNLEAYIGDSISGVRLQCVPFEGWDDVNSPQWWKDYQKIKHSRLGNRECGNLKNAFLSVSALKVLLYIYCQEFNEVVCPPYSYIKTLSKTTYPRYYP